MIELRIEFTIHHAFLGCREPFNCILLKDSGQNGALCGVESCFLYVLLNDVFVLCCGCIFRSACAFVNVDASVPPIFGEWCTGVSGVVGRK